MASDGNEESESLDDFMARMDGAHLHQDYADTFLLEDLGTAVARVREMQGALREFRKTGAVCKGPRPLDKVYADARRAYSQYISQFSETERRMIFESLSQENRHVS